MPYLGGPKRRVRRISSSSSALIREAPVAVTTESPIVVSWTHGQLESGPTSLAYDFFRFLTLPRLARAGAAAAKAAKKLPASKPAAKGDSHAKKKGKAAMKPQAAATTGKKTTFRVQPQAGSRRSKSKPRSR